ncbi:hypothetical protein APF79_02530 [bacterium BRH_c32]|nr:MAG: hypothetical protein APF79_02530 [bacterium BRH_c32]
MKQRSDSEAQSDTGTNNKTNKKNNSFFAVGIGASAGGLDALEKLFGNLSPFTGMAFVVVTHLDPNHISIMPGLIQKYTEMKLFQAESGMEIKPNHIYVAPANHEIGISNGIFELTTPIELHGFRLPIDYFFKSLAKDFGDNAIGIILSGMASDGTQGIKAIKSDLGMVIAQDINSAKYDGMPSSAIKTGLVDYILSPEEMPAQLIKYADNKKDGIFLEQIPEEMFSDYLKKAYSILLSHTGHDFSHYKVNTIQRSLERRMALTQLRNIHDYIDLLKKEPREIENLFSELLIGVTNFFRDKESFDTLKLAIHELILNKENNGNLRIWIPACSTGEEAYSIAIIINECLSETKKNLNVQIFATDIDFNAIEKARKGTFIGIGSDLSNERLERYFRIAGNIFQIKKEIREMIVFAPQSIIKDAPFTNLDLISCRNLLIYFDNVLQRKVIPLFHYSLVNNGILFLGSSETISGFTDLFILVDKKWKIYKKRDSVFSSRPYIEFPISLSFRKITESVMKKIEVNNITELSERIILQNYIVDCVIIKDNGDIVYTYGRTGKYLELSNGEAKMNIFDMARQDLKQELVYLLRKVASSKKSVQEKGVKLKINGANRLINIGVKKILPPLNEVGDFLVTFEEVFVPKVNLIDNKADFDKKTEKVIKELERELKSVKANLRIVIEDLEASNEELKSANEEMQSTNEEMQSTNEELETSKEELQSLNEELITVNTELQNKNEELSTINDDMKNLLDSIKIPTIFLDNNLNIKRFTSYATKVIHLIPSDLGRPINHITTNLKYDNLLSDVTDVLNTLVYKEIELQTKDGIWYQMRILPYRTTNNLIDGVVLTFTEINKLKSANEEIKILNNKLGIAIDYSDNIIDTLRESFLILDDNLKVVSANRSFYKLFNFIKEETEGRYIYELDNNNWDKKELRDLLEEIIPKSNYFEDFELEYDLPLKGSKKLLLNARQILRGDEGTKLILLAIQQK